LTDGIPLTDEEIRNLLTLANRTVSPVVERKL
jgi:hypothetical protein